MNIVKNLEMEQAVQIAEEASKALLKSGKKEFADQLKELVAAVISEKFIIGVVGSAKRGKSTLINGLLGRSDDALAPVGKLPATAVVSIFGHATTASIKVNFRNDCGSKDIPESEIRLYACEEHNSGNRKNVRSIEALGPFPGLEPGVYVVDTPGADNALEELHSEILLQFLPVADAVIFLVTAEEPLTKAEQNLLRSIKGNDTRKIFFAVNKVDLIESGDIKPEELAEGIEHNRKILADVGFSDATILQISAKNYFERHSDTGTEQLIECLRETIAKERFAITVERLGERTRTILSQAEEELQLELNEAKLTAEELVKERKLIAKAKDELIRTRSSRERQFLEQWEDAFDGIESGLQRIRKELVNEYGALIDSTSDMKVAPLAKTIHSDVALSFAERLRPKVIECEAKLNDAQQKLVGSIQTTILKFAPNISPGATSKEQLMNSLEIAASAIPSLLTGTVSVALPGMLGSLIAATAPAIAAGTWNPATWVPYVLTSAASTFVSGTATAVTVALSMVATPVAVCAFGHAAYRAYSTWKSVKAQEKNALKSSVYKMVDDGFEQVLQQMRQYRKGGGEILNDFEGLIEKRIEEADKRIEELIRKPPSKQKLQQLEEGVSLLGEKIKRISAPEKADCDLADNIKGRLLIDELLSK